MVKTVAAFCRNGTMMFHHTTQRCVHTVTLSRDNVVRYVCRTKENPSAPTEVYEHRCRDRSGALAYVAGYMNLPIAAF